MTDIPFVKMHGIGNDYLLVNACEPNLDEPGDPGELSRRMSDRHFGAGSDGLILLLPAEEGVEADMRMRMFNADGSEAEMCGNGIRCLCKLAHDDGVCRRNPMRVQTAAGVLTLDYEVDNEAQVRAVTVDLGVPIHKLIELPVAAAEVVQRGRLPKWEFQVHSIRWVGVFVSVGNPHVVLFEEDNPELMSSPLKDLPLKEWGPPMECCSVFPQRINAHWVQVISPHEVSMRTWERGSGETLGCGTGAAAVCVAGVVTERTRGNVLIHLPGGDLRLNWRQENDHVLLTGPAVEVFRGIWPVP